MYNMAYHSKVIYPSPAAHALQIINMAAALAEKMDQLRLFVRGLNQPPSQIFATYGVSSTTLRLWSIGAARWPSRFKNAPRNRYYNSAIALNLSLHPLWRGQHTNVLFVRNQSGCEYWGQARRFLPWLKHWLFVYEAHDLPHSDFATPAARQTARFISEYDLVLSVTEHLRDDLCALTDQRVPVHTLALSSNLERVYELPPIEPKNTVTIGYIGTIDEAHGLHDVFEMSDMLPDNYRLLLVGRVIDPDWLRQWLPGLASTARITYRPHVPYGAVADVIDSCDIVLAPAGSNIHSERYRSPLKIFDYMMRGKAIVAADVPGHRELLDAQQAMFYSPGNPRELAQVIKTLAENPTQAHDIAANAWHHGAQFTYARRAERILDLINMTAAERK